MDAEIADTAIKVYFREIRHRLDDAARIAKAADVCAQAGSPDKAVHIALDMSSSPTRRPGCSTPRA
jgi:hypothetical protein